MEPLSRNERIPILPVRDIVLFPGVIAPLYVGRPRSLKALEQAMLREKKVFVVAQKQMREDDPAEDDLYEIGTLCHILQIARLPDGTTKILVEGLCRCHVEAFRHEDDFFVADLEGIVESEELSDVLEALHRSVVEHFERYVTLHPRIPAEVLMPVLSAEGAGLAADLVASHMILKVSEKQTLLETFSPDERLEMLLKILLRETDILELEHDIHDRVRQEMEKGQREYYLKEQLRVIQDELGQGDGINEREELLTKVHKAKMSGAVQKKAMKEVDRLSKMPPMSAEATVVRTYLDWLISLPWQKQSRDRLDIGMAAQVLDEDHYGLREVKDRILEFLASRKMAGQEMKGQVLCLVGPPGVGKTSLARSVARALNRQFVQMSLGGMRDEAEIRGHRRTYVGALPGRIIQKIHQAGTRNPVLLLDEIDKVGADFRGDPAAALLEVLDPEQNGHFTDHYLEVPFDLSRVLFVTTANAIHPIPKALLDRMETIFLSGYVAEEKKHIVRRHLLPKVLREHGLKEGDIAFSDQALERIITDYTQEAGVRRLEQQLARIARKVTRMLVEAEEENHAMVRPVKIGTDKLIRFLGTPKSHRTDIPQEPTIGAAVGLAWTETGGDVLVIEAVKLKGKGRITLTGNLGDIMQESAKAALGCLKSQAALLGSDEVPWEELDLHLHVPEGAIPKDGPSAGITMALAIASAFSNRPIRHDVAMTGEMTLLGRVLPIGGVREKVLAARRQGIMDIILPRSNRGDAGELPRWVQRGMSFHYVDTIDEVFDLALTAAGGP